MRNSRYIYRRKCQTALSSPLPLPAAAGFVAFGAPLGPQEVPPMHHSRWVLRIRSQLARSRSSNPRRWLLLPRIKHGRGVSVGKRARSAPWILASVAARFRKRPVLSHGALAGATGAVASFCAACQENKKSRRRSCFIADGPFYCFARFERHGA